jgi:predicted nucleic acid-binding protein
MLVVADTSPINYLVLIAQDAVLPVLYERVVIPPAVLADMQRSRTPAVVRAWAARPPAWLAIQPPRQPLDAQRYPKLGAGEREAIALAQELHVPLLLIDDAEGREEAESRALRATGTLGILDAAALHNLIDLPPVLVRLQATTFRARQELFQDLLARNAARRQRG